MSHLVAMLVIPAILAIIITVLYAVLFIVAVIFNLGIGSPVAYPGWLLLATAFTLLVCLFLGMPTVTIIELLKKRKPLAVSTQLGVIIAVVSCVFPAACLLLPFKPAEAAIFSSLIFAIVLSYWTIYNAAAWILRQLQNLVTRA